MRFASYPLKVNAPVARRSLIRSLMRSLTLILVSLKVRFVLNEIILGVRLNRLISVSWRPLVRSNAERKIYSIAIKVSKSFHRENPFVP